MTAQFSAMEFFGSRGDDPVAACSQEITGCDILVGIYAWRYGWQPGPDSPSITEQEFDCAMQSGKKCLCYIVDESCAWPPTSMDQGSLARHLKRFKRKVGKVVVFSKFTTPDNLAKQVAADLAREMATASVGSPGDLIRMNWEVFSPEVQYGLLTAYSQTRSVNPTGLVSSQDLRAALAGLATTGRPSLTALQGVEPQNPGEADRTRYVGRTEWFGSIVYDRERPDYIPFDRDATDIFRLSQQKSLDQVFELLANRIQRTSFQTFVQLCQSIGILDAKGKFTGAFIRDRSTEGQLSAPLRIHFSCTKACNFRCRHCFSSSGNPYAGELTTGEIKRLIDELADLGCFDLSLGGGEPLVRPDLPDIVKHANIRGVSVRISTNAAAATREVVDTLKGVKIVSFKISMEGASENIYDSIRGEPGSFRAALQGIENLKELKIPILLHRVFMKPNASELPALVRLAEKLKVDRLVLDTVMPVGRAAENPDLLLDWEETNRLWDEAKAIQKSTQLSIDISHQVPPKAGSKFLFGGFGCSCGTVVCHVDARGNVAPTGFLKDTMSAGNLRQQSLKQIWDSGASFVQFRSFRGNAQCTACSYFSHCRGGCRARAVLMDHDINLPDGNCAVAHSE
jgi:radical SAM protein with 4Fe4S-binding SPASM domain